MNRNIPFELPASVRHTGQFRWDLLVSAIVSILGGFLFGFDNIVISGAIRFLSRHFQLGVIGTGWAASCALAGCIVGSSTIGMVVDRIGHKKSLLICTACFATSSVGVWIAHSLTQFVGWRFVGGLGIGAASILAPMYIAEIAPARLRGRLVTLYQAGIVLGILAAVFSNFLIQRLGDEAWNESVGWRLMFLVGFVPAALFGAMILPAVESPRWLFKMGCNQQALNILSRVDDPDQVEPQARSILASLQEEEGRFTELFTTYRRPLLLGIMLAGLQQISGITPIFAFLPEIFRAAGTTRGDSFYQTVLVSVINLIFTFVGLWLVDTAGRRADYPRRHSRAMACFVLGWMAVPCARQWHRHPGLHHELRCRARLWQRHCLLGAHLRVLSHAGARARHVDGDNFPLDRRVSGEPEFSCTDAILRSGRHLLDILRGSAVNHHSRRCPGS